MSSTPQFPATRKLASQAWLSSARSTKVGPIAITAITATHYPSHAVTGPVARFARQIAGQGYICAAPSSYHEFTGPEPLKYDAEDTDKGNAWKIGKVGLSATWVLHV